MNQIVRPSGYSRASIVIHWITAVLVTALFLTHGAERGSGAYAFHVGGGAIAGVFLLWRVWRRIARGMTAGPDQAIVYNILARIVLWGFLTTIAVVTLSGYLLPWSQGLPIEIIATLEIPSPISANNALYDFIDALHRISGLLIGPLVLLHLLGVLKHIFINKDKVVQRMIKPAGNGC